MVLRYCGFNLQRQAIIEQTNPVNTEYSHHVAWSYHIIDWVSTQFRGVLHTGAIIDRSRTLLSAQKYSLCKGLLIMTCIHCI